MRRFKPGQKVVYVARYEHNPEMTYPKDGEIVTIKSYCSVFSNNYDIEGYEISKRGVSQSFQHRCFEPLIPTRERVEYKLSKPVPQELLTELIPEIA